MKNLFDLHEIKTSLNKFFIKFSVAIVRYQMTPATTDFKKIYYFRFMLFMLFTQGQRRKCEKR